jgi:uncharacterized repeat protein (TIGR01451 family)
VATAAVVWAVSALSAPAQPEPQPLPPSVRPTPDEEFPPIEDPDVQPAQFTLPGERLPSGTPAAPVADPPPPVVRIQVRVHADSPPGDDIKYLITVQNASQADAHGVTVRVPLPEGVESAVKTDPEPVCETTKTNQKQLVWSFGTLGAGKSKPIELTLRPRPGATEVKCLAYVKFEHGQAVTTKIQKPAVRVTKLAPKQSVRDEPFTVRIAVDNTGRVPAERVRVVENLPTSAEFEAVTKGAKRTDRRDAAVHPAAGPAEGQQWVWEIDRLMPGERKIIEYRVTAREAKDVFTLTNLAADKGATDKAEAKTQVLVPGLALKLDGPPGNAPVNPGEAAKYEITVRNTGTLPCANVRVTGTLPAGCKPTMKTEGGTLYRDTIVWVIPRLDAGEAQTFRFAIKAGSTGRRSVAASAADSRGQRAAGEVATVFQGTAALVWESVPNPVALSAGKQGTFTVRVRNNGGEAARNVRLEMELPDAVSLVQATPMIRPTGNKLLFNSETIAAGGEATYTITYEARQAAQAWFKLKMTADSLGSRPMQTEKAVEITGAAK